ncbi:hypothetical protein Landi51_07985 [Colletotrichum acutatum]
MRQRANHSWTPNTTTAISLARQAGAAPRIPIPSHRGRRAAPLYSPQTHTRTHTQTADDRRRSRASRAVKNQAYPAHPPFPVAAPKSPHVHTPSSLPPSHTPVPVPVPPSPFLVGRVPVEYEPAVRSTSSAKKPERAPKTHRPGPAQRRGLPSIHPSIWCPAPVPSFLDLVFSTLRNLNLCSIEPATRSNVSHDSALPRFQRTIPNKAFFGYTSAAYPPQGLSAVLDPLLSTLAPIPPGGRIRIPSHCYESFGGDWPILT